MAKMDEIVSFLNNALREVKYPDGIRITGFQRFPPELDVVHMLVERIDTDTWLRVLVDRREADGISYQGAVDLLAVRVNDAARALLGEQYGETA